MKPPILLSVPHAGLRIPEEVRRYCVLTPREVEEDSDEGAGTIYTLGDEVGAFLTTDVARAVVDLNRAEDDRRADGVVKTHTSLDVPVYDRPLPAELIEDLLERYHRPYHRELTRLATGPSRIGIDCHTMLAVGPPMGPMAGEERPAICLGNVDGETCPQAWFETLAECLREAFEIEPALNDPFKGGFVTRSHGSELPWVQLELSRAPFLPDQEKRRRVLEAITLFADRIFGTGQRDAR